MQELHPVSAAIDKHEQAAIGRIGLELGSDNSTEPIEPFSHVGRFGVSIDFRLAGDVQHGADPDRSFSAFITSRITASMAETLSAT